MIGLPVFVGGALVGYLVREFAVGRLTPLELGTLSVNLRPLRLRYICSMGTVLAAFFVLRFSIPKLMNFWFLFFLGVCAAITVGFEFYGWRQFVAKKFSRGFVFPYSVSRLITTATTLVLYGALAATVLV